MEVFLFPKNGKYWLTPKALPELTMLLESQLYVDIFGIKGLEKIHFVADNKLII